MTHVIENTQGSTLTATKIASTTKATKTMLLVGLLFDILGN